MEFLTTAEFAKKINVSARTVAYYCSQGRIPGVIKKGKTWLIPADVEKMFEVEKKKTKKNVEDSITYADIDGLNEMAQSYTQRSYNVKALEKFLGTTRETVRYYEQQGLIKTKRSAGNDYRIFKGFDVFRLTAIDYYRKRGFSIAEIKETFGFSQVQELYAPIKKKKKELKQIIESHQEALKRLETTEQFIREFEKEANMITFKELPKVKITNTFSSFYAFDEYQEKVLSDNNTFSGDMLSSFVRVFYFDEKGYTGSQMCVFEQNNNPVAPKTPCLNLKMTAKTSEDIDFSQILEKGFVFAQEHNIELQGIIYSFNKMLLLYEDMEVNYYDIYAPIK